MCLWISQDPKMQLSPWQAAQQHFGFVFIYFLTQTIASAGWWAPPGSDSFQLPQIPILGGESPAAGAQPSQISQVYI